MLSHTATGEWQSFELRMRRRRAERLALRAQAAAAAGFEDDARECLAEARTLAPDLPEIAAAEATLTRQYEPPQIVVEPHPPSRFPFIACATACILLAAFLGGWLAYRDVPEGTQLAPTKVEAAAVREAPAPPVSARKPVVESPIVEPANVESANVVSAPAPARAEAPIAEGPAAPTPPSVRTSEGLPTLPDPVPAAAAPAPPARVEAPPERVEPAPVVTPAAPAAGIADTVVPPPSVDVKAPIVEPSQEPLVRAVLNRYASAYNSLDADAAERVWPTVNRGALARAFDGLATQSVSLGDCRIDVTDNNARARCAGSATWSPKVGAGTHTELRVWTFDLVRVGTGWQILNARVQNR